MPRAFLHAAKPVNHSGFVKTTRSDTRRGKSVLTNTPPGSMLSRAGQRAAVPWRGRVATNMFPLTCGNLL